MIRVVIVDDQELVRAGLRGILRPELGFEVVGECADGRAIADVVAATSPDVVLMDARMPDVDGIRATEALRSDPAAPPVLALTTFDDDEILAGMLRAGAAGFALKGVAAEDLQRAVRVVAAGEAWLDPSVTARVLTSYRAQRSDASAEHRPPPALSTLTGKEREVLAHIGRGDNNAEIARELHISEGTVKTHINRLFAKLSLRDRPAAVIYAIEHGVTVAPDG
jgi:DNA-binding NarL/FixJ family response regulator